MVALFQHRSQHFDRRRLQAVIALWALFAAYIFGKGSRQRQQTVCPVSRRCAVLVYLAAPFVRGDNVSLFFFERTNADKFMVPLTMLPVVLPSRSICAVGGAMHG